MTQPDSSVPSEVFLSHAGGDRGIADRLSEELTRHGVPHWFSRRELVGAQQWHDEIGEALERCDWFAVILTPRSVVSLWVKRELLFALGDPRFERRIVPILAEDCSTRQLSWALDQHQRVDFRVEWEQGMRDLLRIWGIGYRS